MHMQMNLGSFRKSPRVWQWLALATSAAVLVACSSGGGGRYSSRHDGAPSAPPDVQAVPDAVPKAEPRSRYGNPSSYVVLGKRYHVMSTSAGYKERGVASWYGTKFHGHRTSSGESYDMYAMTAAHKSLPLPTYAEVTNLRNGRTVVVKVNDRGPFHDNRIIDLSYAAAAKLGILGEGTGLVEVRAIDPRQRQSEPRVIEARNTSAPSSSTPSVSSRPAAASANPELYLQVGAFSSRSNAERLSSKLREEKLASIQISEGMSNQRPVFRVRIGPLTSVEEADRMASSLGRHGISDPHVVID